MTDTVIFDLGRVLVEFQPVEGMRRLGFTDEQIKVISEKIFSGLWEECDRIPYSDNEIRRLFKSRLPGMEALVDRMWDNVTVFTDVYPYSRKWLQSLKDMGLKIYILSNYGKQAFEVNSKKYDFLELADGMVISYQVELVKPELQIYEILLEKYGIERQNAVFIDDRQLNIDGARAVGMKAILFENYEKTSAELLKLIQDT
ncbi:MAG: HAD family phosphatase [Lachnospiraceae bacterium]|nr:HAD family phosphatase [Lachnospiraceae bacterium]